MAISVSQEFEKFGINMDVYHRWSTTMKGGGGGCFNTNSRQKSDAACIRPVCDLSCVRKIIFLVQEWELFLLSTFFMQVPLPTTRLDKDKSLCAVWIYFNAVRRLGYGNVLKKCFEVKNFRHEKVLRGPAYSRRGPRDCAFLLVWWNIWMYWAWNPRGKEGLLFQEVKISGSNQTYEWSSWQLLWA